LKTNFSSRFFNGKKTLAFFILHLPGSAEATRNIMSCLDWLAPLLSGPGWADSTNQSFWPWADSTNLFTANFAVKLYLRGIKNNVFFRESLMSKNFL
jgi:hypothetical protein